MRSVFFFSRQVFKKFSRFSKPRKSVVSHSNRKTYDKEGIRKFVAERRDGLNLIFILYFLPIKYKIIVFDCKREKREKKNHAQFTWTSNNESVDKIINLIRIIRYT